MKCPVCKEKVVNHHIELMNNCWVEVFEMACSKCLGRNRREGRGKVYGY